MVILRTRKKQRAFWFVFILNDLTWHDTRTGSTTEDQELLYMGRKGRYCWLRNKNLGHRTRHCSPSPSPPALGQSLNWSWHTLTLQGEQSVPQTAHTTTRQAPHRCTWEWAGATPRAKATLHIRHAMHLITHMYTQLGDYTPENLCLYYLYLAIANVSIYKTQN